MSSLQSVTVKQPTTTEIIQNNEILVQSIEVKYKGDRKRPVSIKVKPMNGEPQKSRRYGVHEAVRWDYNKRLPSQSNLSIVVREHCRAHPVKEHVVEVKITDDMIVKPIIIINEQSREELSVKIHCDVAGPFIEWVRCLIEESQSRVENMKEFMENLGKACEILNYFVNALELASDVNSPACVAVSAVKKLSEKCKEMKECHEAASSLMADVASFLPFVNVPKYRTKSDISDETVQKILKLFEKISMMIIEYSDDTTLGIFLRSRIDNVNAFKEELRRLKETFDWCIKTEVWKAVLTTEKHTKALVLDKLRPELNAFYKQEKTCFEGTRKDTLQMIEDWSTSNSKLFWLYGSTFSGKTSISHTIAERFDGQHRLAGCFFCDKSNANLCDPVRIIPTIAYQFAKWHNDYRSLIVEVLRGRGELDLNVGLARQFNLLVKGPIAKSSVHLSPEHRPLIIVLDALDECGEDAASRRYLAEFIRDISNAAPWMKVFVSSATSTELKDCFLQDDTRHLDISDPSLDLRNDVATYLEYSIKDCQVSSQVRREQAHKASGLLSRFHWTFQMPGSDSRAQADGTDDRSSAQALECLDVMKTHLKFNTCGLESAYLVNVDMEGLSSKVERNIPDILRYSSLSWIDHILQSRDAESLHSSVMQFLCSAKALFWVEVLGLLGVIEKGKESLLQCAEKFKDVDEIVRSATELHEFIYTFHGVIEASTPHLYISALAWAPSDSTVVRHASTAFKGWKPPLSDELPKQVYLANTSESPLQRKAGISLLKGYTRNIRNAKYTPDGSKIVSLSWQNALQIWGAKSGEAKSEPFGCHVPEVGAIAYSRDGTRIASGSIDGKLRIWDAHTGALLIESQEGHEYGIGTLAYSPDGTRIVTGSRDKVLRIWDAQSGAVVGEPLTGQNGGVKAVTYAPDGRRIVSGSNDGLLRVWDLQSGTQIGEPLTGHRDRVWAVAYAPDGSRIVSGSEDETLRIWDVQSGEPIGEPLKGHSNEVNGVAYSPDGTRIVSGSSDWTLRIWDARSGKPIGEPLKGHSSKVISVAYSLDGSRIVSGSSRGTLRIWDAHSGEPIGKPLNGHEAIVWSVAYSPDGNRIASGSWDGTIRIWDAHNGSCVKTMFLGECRWDPDVQCFLTAAGNVHGLSIAHTANPSAIPDDGWLRTLDGSLFLWVPPEHRRSICGGQVCIPKNENGKLMYIDWTKIPHGKDWTKIMAVEGSDKD